MKKYRIEKTVTGYVKDDSEGIETIKQCYLDLQLNNTFDIVDEDTGEIYVTKKDGAIVYVEESLFRGLLLLATQE